MFISMQTQQNKIITASEKFLFAHITGLLAFAKTHDAFSESFAAAIQKQNWVAGTAIESGLCNYTTPHSLPDAVDTTHWILNTLQTHPEYTHTRGALASWAQQFESPKDVVLGIVGVAIIGPTLGLISSKKKKKRKAQLVIETEYYQSLSKNELAILTTALTQALLATEIKLAGGNVYNLHPDSAAWCIEDAITAIYTDSADNIRSLHKIATEESASCITQKGSNNNIQILVISPSVNDSLVEESDAQLT